MWGMEVGMQGIRMGIGRNVGNGTENTGKLGKDDVNAGNEGWNEGKTEDGVRI